MNIVTITGNLTRDPELKTTSGGMTIAKLRIAVNDRVKDPNTGEWGDRPNYFDVDVFGKLAETVGKYAGKGRKLAISGRLHWHEWEANDGAKRQAVSIVANEVEFLDKPAQQGQGGDLRSEAKAAFNKAGVAVADYEPDFEDGIPFE